MLPLFSCSENNDPSPEETRLNLITSSVLDNSMTLELYAAETLFAGYNPVTFAVKDGDRLVRDVEIEVSPVMTMTSMSHGCPVEQPVFDGKQFYTGAILFNMPSGDAGTWALHVAVTVEDNVFDATLPVDVQATDPSRMMSFTGDDDESYLVGYWFPEGMRVGVNPVVVIVYTRDDHHYHPVEDLVITLTPDMPSMGHGSPNNEDPTHKGEGHYLGKVNFTMTGDWRLTLDLKRGDTPIATRAFDVILN